MIYLLIGVIIIVFIFYILLGISNSYEDNNYSALKKLFFSVNPENIDCKYLDNNNNVYGILIEINSKKNEKILIASYITGFTGFYKNRGGGIIGGTHYHENHPNVQQELMKLCNKNMLNGENQTKQTRNLATRLTIKANDSINHSTPCGSNIGGNLKGNNFWFLSKGEVYSVDSDSLKLNEHKFSGLITDASKIVKELKINNENKKASHNNS